MRTKLRRMFTRYFNSWWIPVAICLVFIAILFILTSLAKASWPETSQINSVLSAFTLLGLAIASCGLICSLVWHLFKKRWKKLGGALLGSLVALIGLYFLATSILTMLWLWPVEDNFAKNLTIPEGIEVAEPISRDAPSDSKSSEFQPAVLTALTQPSRNDATITANIDSLSSLYANAPDVLQRYLAMNPAWFVSEGSGLVAVRRWQIDSTWQEAISGQYSELALDNLPKSLPAEAAYDLQVKIDLSKYPLSTSTSTFTTFLSPGETSDLSLSSDEFGYSSRCVIQASGFSVDITENSGSKGRTLTQAALTFIEKELAPLAAQPSEATIRAALPAGSIRQGDESITLKELSQRGTYQATSWINPGEPGSVYLKAFEVTKNTPLSAQLLQLESTEQVGWSESPDELFMANANIKIDEGSWGQPYAARFEVWFSPDAGASGAFQGGSGDRKLLEKVFKIEGWEY